MENEKAKQPNSQARDEPRKSNSGRSPFLNKKTATHQNPRRKMLNYLLSVDNWSTPPNICNFSTIRERMEGREKHTVELKVKKTGENNFIKYSFETKPNSPF